MNKTLLILKHEFRTMMTAKGFIILTLLFPMIGLTAIGIFMLVQAAGSEAEDEITVIGYVDEVGGFLASAVYDLGGVELVPYPEESAAVTAVFEEDIDECFIIPPDYLESGVVTRYLKEKELEMPGETYRAIRAFLQDGLLKDQTSPEIIERVKNPLGIRTVRLDETGKPATDQGGASEFVISLVFGFLLILAIGSSSGTLLQGLGEEKQNRIIEVLLSSVSTRQLLLGKVLGLGGAGLVQICFWLLSMVIILQIASDIVGGFFTSVQVPTDVIVLGIIYFILGYLFFAVMQAGIGAIFPNPKDSPQITMAFIFPAILPFYISFLFLKDNPDHIIGRILTFIPVSAPMSVFVRIGLAEIAPWEIALSIAILLLSIVGGLWLASKTFRVFLLMHGKMPKFGEILRLLKQA